MSPAPSTSEPAELAPPLHLSEARRALAVLAHPDDESWAFGGLLTRLAIAGVHTHLLCLTRGEAGGDPQVRLGELARAAELLGIKLHTPETWGRDGALDPNHAARESALLLRTFQPDLLLLFDEEGGYGHRDHVACSRGTLQAATESAPQVLSPLYPRDHFRPLQRALRRRTPHLLAPSLATRTLGRDPQSAHFRVTPTREEAQRKRAALRAHASQHRPGPSGPAFLFAPVFEPLLEDEWYLLRDAKSALASFT